MIWVALLALAAVTLAPLAITLGRGARARGRREAALALHRAQLAELDRDAAEGRLAESERAQAVLEVQRRMLAEAEQVEAAPATASRGPLLLMIGLVPAAALALYLVNGDPGLPAAPLAARIAAAQQRAKQEAVLVEELKHELARMAPHDARARQGYILLGRVELSLGDRPAAAAAWNTALQTRFDATLAAETAEVETEIAGHVTFASATLFRRALDAAEPDAPWRPMAERRLAEAQTGTQVTPSPGTVGQP
ncbi:MAG TPA: c-type cytochrome biogenesis protein CcmI [Acetobacteraceae bacterium]|nr:c-type cytochrome biogenesis protein CcmI [Acetobacteraceae bacterium]